ncbi:NADPH-dependent F420 reductase [Anaeromyxobacter sp. SG17]|uniref:NADPH-dependent F420 reductase n=1 Tax=Anaeromyxobacter sp. SG17 TaxID=2925405 RepID=UPI001F58F097|nr:NAD(P)-binding domain-containing protein [Anaeromyxobacter sp. SG17]
MRIGIIGSGNIGGTAARLFTEAGHEVALSHASGPHSLRDQVAAPGPRARATTVDEAAEFGEVVLIAIPWRNRRELPAERLRGKIVIDAMNPYRPDFKLYELGDSTSSEEVARVIPGARLVKALNHLYANDLATRGRRDLPPEERVALLIAGDDPDAKRAVANLVEEIGFAPVDTGSLRYGGRLQEPGSPLYGRIVSGTDAQAALRRGDEARSGSTSGAERQH